MEFGNNLQSLRKKLNISQEELSNKLDVSRQAISKWESGAGYPEMDKIIKLCEIFNCSMDDLIRGEVKNSDNTLYTKCSKAIALGVTLILIGTTLLIYMAGFNNDKIIILGVAALLLMVLIAVPIFIYYGTALDEIRDQKIEVSSLEIKKFKRIYPVTVSIGVSLIILGVIIMILLYGLNLVGENSTLPLTILLSCVTLAVPIFIYYGMKRESYGIVDSHKNSKEDKYSGAIMLTATFLFLLLGFVFNLWKICWVVFPLGGILCGIVSTLVDKEK